MRIEPTGVKLLPHYTGPVTNGGGINGKLSAEKRSLILYAEHNEKVPDLKVTHENLRLLYAIKAVEAYSPVCKPRYDGHRGVLIDVYV